MNELVARTDAEKRQEIHRLARELYRRNADWVTFFRDILGRDGVVRRFFSTPASLADFERTETYAEIQQWLTELREHGYPGPGLQEPTRVITVRLPKSLHEALRAEAHDHRTSMNKLCISKLMQLIDNELVPDEQ